MEEYLSHLERSREKADRFLDPILRSASLSPEAFLRCLRGYLLARFQLNENAPEHKLYYLAIRSIKQAAGENPDINTRIRKPDCQKADAAVSKVTLFIGQVENLLHIHFSDEEFDAIDTIEDLAEAAYRKYYGEDTT